MTESPSAQVYMNYPGDQSEHIGEVKGPNSFREFLTIVSVDYSPENNTSRVGFRYGASDGKAIGNHLEEQELINSKREEGFTSVL